MNKYFDDANCTEDIYIFGVNAWGLALACYFIHRKHKVFFLDNNKALHRKSIIWDILCLDPIDTNITCTHFICVRTNQNRLAINQQLTEYGCIDIRETNYEMDEYLNKMEDFDYLKCFWYIHMHSDIDLLEPKTFNEKIQWLKLHDRNPRYSMLVDKYAVKEYVSELIGNQYINHSIAVWENAEDIDFTLLPKEVVLKCTHDSGSTIIVTDKKNQQYYDDIRKKLNQKLKENFYFWGREWAYKDVQPKIIAEPILKNDDGTEILDYKFMCFNGVVKCIFVCSERTEELKVTFFDLSWQRLPFIRHYPASSKEIEKPTRLDEMIYLAEILSKGIPFVRIDFFLVNNNPIFSEYTFYPGCGIEEFYPEKWDDILGEWLDIKNVNTYN